MVDPRRLRTPPSSLDRASFVALYGGAYEHSPHFAEAVFPQAQSGMLDTLAGLSSALRQAVDTGSRDAKRQLILAHPDLANRLGAMPLTSASASEQAGAGLDRCTPDEFEEFVGLNQAYRSRFGIPFIKAVRGFSRGQILDEFRRRLANDTDAEFATAIEEIHKIALLRLTDLIEQVSHD